MSNMCMYGETNAIFRTLLLFCLGGISGWLSAVLYESADLLYSTPTLPFLLWPGAVFGVFAALLALFNKKPWWHGLLWLVGSSMSFFAAWWTAGWVVGKLGAHGLCVGVFCEALAFGAAGFVGSFILFLTLLCTQRTWLLKSLWVLVLPLSVYPALLTGVMTTEWNYFVMVLMCVWQAYALVALDVLFRGCARQGNTAPSTKYNGESH